MFLHIGKVFFRTQLRAFQFFGGILFHFMLCGPHILSIMELCPRTCYLWSIVYVQYPVIVAAVSGLQQRAGFPNLGRGGPAAANPIYMIM